MLCYVCATELNKEDEVCRECETPTWYTEQENLKNLVLYLKSEGQSIDLEKLILSPEKYAEDWEKYIESVEII
jgi:predicted amidophosphoribosyltransferase